MDYQHIVIHRPENEIKLETEIAMLRREVDRLYSQVKELESKYGYESRLNNELIDILRDHKIPFRPALESAKNR